MNNQNQFSIHPKFSLSFDEKFPSGVTLNNAQLVNAFSGKGIETRSAKRSSGVSFGYRGLSKYIEGASGFTLSMWIMTYTSYFNTYALANIYTDDGKLLFRLDYLGGRMEVKVRSMAEETPVELKFVYKVGSVIVPFGPSHCNDGVWQLVTVSVDYENNTVKLFINGQEIAPQELPEINFARKRIEAVTTSTPDDFIGSDPTGYDWSYSGIIDEINLFDKPFSADEALALYNTFGEAETISPTDDQRMLEKLLEKLGSGWAFSVDSSKFVYIGKTKKADCNDYSVKVRLKDGDAVIPSNCAERYFKAAVEKLGTIELDEIKYYSLKAICKELGMNFVDVTDTYGLFIVCAEDTTLSSEDGILLERLKEVCKELLYEPTVNVEDTRVVAEYLDVAKKEYAYSPGLVSVNGVLYASYDINCKRTVVLRSTDNGATWEKRGIVEKMFWASLFEHRGDLYILGTYDDPKYHMAITRSTDGGLTWSEIKEGQGAITYFDRTSHGAPTPVVKYNGRIYRVFESTDGGYRELFISADENSNLIDPQNWKFHDYLHLEENAIATPETPQKIMHHGKWICEGNAVVGKDGRLYCLSRCESFPVHNKGFLSVLSEDGERLEAIQVIDFFGGQTKFTVRYDAVNEKYLAIVNYIPDGEIAPYQRNYAALTASDDLIHWELREILLCDRNVMNKFYSMSRHGYQYIDWNFDGEDILMAVREAQDNSRNFHDNNYLTIYRIKNYAKLL